MVRRRAALRETDRGGARIAQGHRNATLEVACGLAELALSVLVLQAARATVLGCVLHRFRRLAQRMDLLHHDGGSAEDVERLRYEDCIVCVDAEFRGGRIFIVR